MGWNEAKKQVLEAALEIHRKGLVVGTCGNVSLRLAPEGGRGLLAVTPTSRSYETLSADDIQVIDFGGRVIEGDLPASVESNLHIGIYRARPHVNAVIHTHSVYASAISVAGFDIPPLLEDQVVFLGGEIKLAAHASSGSEEMVFSVVSALDEKNAALLPNHGAVAVGRTLREALTAAELLEKTARVYCVARSLGKVRPITGEALQAGMAVFRKLQGGNG